MSEAAAETEHLPERPTWDCLTCGKEWPCDPAREQLSAQHVNDRVALAMLMWSYLEDFAGDAGAGPLAGTFDRFIRWTR